MRKETGREREKTGRDRERTETEREKKTKQHCQFETEKEQMWVVRKREQMEGNMREMKRNK